MRTMELIFSPFSSTLLQNVDMIGDNLAFDQSINAPKH